MEYKITAQYVHTPYNKRLMETNDYMNPLILEKALDLFDLDQYSGLASRFEPSDYYEELAQRQNEMLQVQQEEMMKKRRMIEAQRQSMVEQRAIRIAEIVGATDVKQVEEQLIQQSQQKQQSRFDSFIH